MKRMTNKLSLKGKLSLKRNKSYGENATDVKKEEVTQIEEECSKPSLLESIAPPAPYAGLQNIGNTCFFNSVLQALRYTPGFRDGIKMLALHVKSLQKEEEEKMANGDYESPGITNHMQFLLQFDKLLQSMQRSEEQYLEDLDIQFSLSVFPENLLNILKIIKPMFEGYLQHDAQELLCCILSIIQDGCQELKSRLQDGRKPEKDSKRKFKQTGKLLGGMKTAKKAGESSVAHIPRPSSSSVTRKSPGNTVQEFQTKKKTLGIRRLKRPQDQKPISMFIGSSTIVTNNASETDVKIDSNAKKIKIEHENDSKLKIEMTVETKLEVNVNKSEKLEGMEVNSVENINESSDQQPQTVSSKKGVSMSSTSNDLNLVERLFQGLVVSRTRCSECEKFNERTEDFQEVGLPVQKMSDATNSNDCDLRPTNLSLSWALAEYTCTERLTDANKYFCERCMQHNEAERSVLFHKLPSVLIFHLKRFSTMFSGFYPESSVSKVNTHLATPLTLTLAPWCSKQCKQRNQKYELYAVVMHSGTSIACGHYVCYARVPSYNVKADGIETTQSGSKWARFDDDMVEVLSEDNITSMLCPITSVHHSATPYLLFYKELDKM